MNTAKGLFPEPLDVPLGAQIACIKREIAMRQRAYPRWIAGGRMSQGKADQEIAAMSAVLRTLEGLEQACKEAWGEEPWEEEP